MKYISRSHAQTLFGSLLSKKTMMMAKIIFRKSILFHKKEKTFLMISVVSILFLRFHMVITVRPLPFGYFYKTSCLNAFIYVIIVKEFTKSAKYDIFQIPDFRR